ncbi:recombinase RecA [Chlamydiota bacterium]
MAVNNKEEKKTIEGVKESKRDVSLDLAVSQIEKQFGVGSVMRLGSNAMKVDVPTISTGALTLDIALGIGGVPRGRVIEIFGPEASGKTTLALQIVANAQKNGGSVAFIDAEHAVDPEYARAIGVDIDNLLISQPDCGEDALNIAELLVRSNALDVVVIDSVAALVPRAEIEGEIGDSFIGLQARMMSQALRKLTSAISKSKTCSIFINQIREKIGVMFGNPETTPGGRALKFYSSIRMDIRRIAAIKHSNGSIVGNRTKVKVVKNKMAPPFRIAEFDIIYGYGISREGTILEVAAEEGIVEKKGSWYDYLGERFAQGKDQAVKHLKENKDFSDKILSEIKDKLALK